MVEEYIESIQKLLKRAIDNNISVASWYHFIEGQHEGEFQECRKYPCGMSNALREEYANITGGSSGVS